MTWNISVHPLSHTYRGLMRKLHWEIHQKVCFTDKIHQRWWKIHLCDIHQAVNVAPFLVGFLIASIDLLWACVRQMFLIPIIQLLSDFQHEKPQQKRFLCILSERRPQPSFKLHFITSCVDQKQASVSAALLLQSGLQEGYNGIGIPLLDAKRLLDVVVFVHQFNDWVCTTHVLDVQTRKLKGLVALHKRWNSQGKKKRDS